LKRLEEKGFVHVRPDENSGRRKLVTITAEGQRARLEAIKAVEPLLEEVLVQFKASQFAAGLPLLEQLRTFLDLRRDV